MPTDNAKSDSNVLIQSAINKSEGRIFPFELFGYKYIYCDAPAQSDEKNVLVCAYGHDLYFRSENREITPISWPDF